MQIFKILIIAKNAGKFFRIFLYEQKFYNIVKIPIVRIVKFFQNGKRKFQNIIKKYFTSSKNLKIFLLKNIENPKSEILAKNIKKL